MAKVQITGASDWVNRMYEACGLYQWAREFAKNSLEAGATRIEFGIEWQSVEKQGVYRRTVVDNGSGMDGRELLTFFSTLGEGAKKIGGIHDNFGVGAKIASLPWNPNGLVVISYKDNQAAMIQIVLEPESNDYELVEFEVAGGRSAVIDPAAIDWSAVGDIDWSALRPEWLKENGTIVVLLGSDSYPDTVMGNPAAGEQAIKGLSVYLNSRFWDLAKVEMRVVELRSEKKNTWPLQSAEKDDARRPNNRRIQGAKHYLTEVDAKSGKLGASDVCFLDEERVAVEWYLWKGERPHVDSYAKKSGYIGVRYNDELFELTSGKVPFRWFGVVEQIVQQNLSIILEPGKLSLGSGRWGVHPDQSRNRLIFTGDGEKGASLPLHKWGAEFAEDMPQAIRDAIALARGDSVGTIEDDEYRKRLQDRFGDRWTTRMKVMVRPRNTSEPTTPADSQDEQVEIAEDILAVRPYSRRKRPNVVRRLVPKAYTGADGVAVERVVVVDIPTYRYGPKENFEQPWHMALWDEARNEVELNSEAPVLLEAIKYHQDQYADVFAEDVGKAVMAVFGEVAVAKIAHSQRLRGNVSDQELRDDYRNERVLTVALMGLLAEESLIAQRLGKFGRKKDKAAGERTTASGG